MMSTNVRFFQEAFQAECFKKGNAYDRLIEQQSQTYAIDAALRKGDLERLSEAVELFDLTLARRALAHLQSALCKAAIQDAATLLKERILDTCDEQPSLERLVQWLSLAQCWPLLAQENWSAVVSEAEDMLIADLEVEGVSMNDDTKKSLFLAIRNISIADLIPKDEYERIFMKSAEVVTQGDNDF